MSPGDPDERDAADPGRAPTESSDRAGAESVAPATSASRGFRAAAIGAALGRYELVEELGEGGMATVYRARDAELRRDVAVKVLFPHLAKRAEVVRRFDREARAAAGLEHPNILRVYDVGGGDPGGDPPYIVMELVRGESLKDTVDRRGALLAELCACVGALLADALAAAHAAGIVHRDVKPANVMIAPGGRLLLADFGVARVEDDDSLVTRTGALLGTPAFMAPEQATGAAVDARSDVYSLGATLYQLATGALPYTGPTARVVAAIAAGELVSPLRRRPAVGTELSRLVERLMAVEPERRPATAAAAAVELRAYLAEAGFGDPADELAAYFADPDGFVAARMPALVTGLAARARAARAAAKLPRALALADRASALAPDDPAIAALVAELAVRPATARWLLVAGAGSVALAGAAVIGFLARGGEGAELDAATPDAAGAPPALDASIAAVPAVDARAATPPPVDARAATPPPVDAPPGATRPDARRRAVDARVAIGPPDAAALAAVPDAAVARPAIDAAPGRTAITVIMDSWCTLSIDGVDVGRADARPRTFEVSPGDHDVTCAKDKIADMRWSERVHVDAGQIRTVRGALLGKVRVTIGTTRAIVIEGTSYGPGDTLALTPGRHRAEVGGTATYLDIPRTPCTIRPTDSDRLVDCFP